MDERLTKLWTVHLEWQGSIKKAAADIIDLLMQLEARGFQHGSLDTLFALDRSLYEAAERLKIWGVGSIEPTERHPPGYYLMAAPWGGAVPTTENLPKFVEDTLQGDDMKKLRTQLGRGLVDADERHAFLIVTFTDLMHLPLTSDADGEIPNAAPSLPDPIDGVWLVSDRANARIVAWLPRRGWVEMPAPWR
jgi:hypothetical protein